MGPIVENQIPAFVNSPQYQQADDETKYIMLEDAMSRARSAAGKMAAREDPGLASKVKFGKMKKSHRRLYNARRRRAEERSERMRDIMEERA